MIVERTYNLYGGGEVPSRPVQASAATYNIRGGDTTPRPETGTALTPPAGPQPGADAPAGYHDQNFGGPDGAVGWAPNDGAGSLTGGPSGPVDPHEVKFDKGARSPATGGVTQQR